MSFPGSVARGIRTRKLKSNVHPYTHAPLAARLHAYMEHDGEKRRGKERRGEERREELDGSVHAGSRAAAGERRSDAS